MYSLFKHDTVLDAEKLRDSLERLVTREGWRKLGARLRKNVPLSEIKSYLPVGNKCLMKISMWQDKDDVEHHIPTKFSRERHAVSFSHVQHTMSIRAHPLAAKLPEPNGTLPAVVGDPDEFTPLIRVEAMPTKFEDYLAQDRGQLGLHVMSFTHATLVVLYYDHTSFDLTACGALITARTHGLHGREDLVATPFGADTDGFDPLRDMGTNPTKPPILADRQTPLSGLLGYGIRNLVDLAWRSKENPIMCVPGAFLGKLRDQPLSELGASGEQQPFLSEGDVLAAWWVRLLVSLLAEPGCDRTITIQYAASARNALSLLTDPDIAPYVNNMFTMLYTLLPRTISPANLSAISRGRSVSPSSGKGREDKSKPTWL